MKRVPLTKGMFALVDDDDYDTLVAMGSWYAHRADDRWYARITVGGRATPQRLFMHRVLLDAKRGVLVDHRDSDGLNNQRHNLRLATSSQNGMNKTKTGSRSQYKGVWPTPSGWKAMIRGADGARHYLGHFQSERSAAEAYDRGAIEHHGEFANTNFCTEHKK